MKTFICVHLNALQRIALVAMHLKFDFYPSSFFLARKSSASLTCGDRRVVYAKTGTIQFSLASDWSVLKLMRVLREGNLKLLSPGQSCNAIGYSIGCLVSCQIVPSRLASYLTHSAC